MKTPEINPPRKPLKALFDLIITLLLWSYYTLGFIFFFSPFYLAAYLFSENCERSFQLLNHRFYKGFFLLARILIPWTKWRIQDEVCAIRSSVAVQSLSSSDPLIRCLKAQDYRKPFFQCAYFCRVLELSGYILLREEPVQSDHPTHGRSDATRIGWKSLVFPEEHGAG
jgi:1-acyl-sn-glycerol-3-phosphate acyltransferase